MFPYKKIGIPWARTGGDPLNPLGQDTCLCQDPKLRCADRGKAGPVMVVGVSAFRQNLRFFSSNAINQP